jgi:hypothetical protein
MDLGKIARQFEKGEKENNRPRRKVRETHGTTREVQRSGQNCQAIREWKEGGRQTTEKGNLKHVGQHMRSKDPGKISRQFEKGEKEDERLRRRVTETRGQHVRSKDPSKIARQFEKGDKEGGGPRRKVT